MPAASAARAHHGVLRALERYDAAMATEAVDAYLGCFRSEMGLTAGYGGTSLAVSGVEELRAAIENLFAAGLSHVHQDVTVVSREPARAVAHYTRLISQDGTPLIEVEIEREVAFEGELIRRMAIREPARRAMPPSSGRRSARPLPSGERSSPARLTRSCWSASVMGASANVRRPRASMDVGI